MNEVTSLYPTVTCRLCNETVQATYMDPTKTQMVERSLCFYCNFWINTRDEDLERPGRAVITEDYEHYVIAEEGDKKRIGEEKWGRGFGGRLFVVRFINVPGRPEVLTTNLWSQGEIPEHLRRLFLPNAELIDAWGYRWWEDKEELVAFGAVLVEGEALPTRRDLIYYLEKPQKWVQEYWMWRQYGKPLQGETGWTDLWNEAVMNR